MHTASELYRLFVAADLPMVVKDELAAVQNEFKRRRLPVKWAAPHGMHLTLAFLGDTDAALVPSIGAALRARLAEQTAARLRLEQLGAFPNVSRPSIVWAGVGGDLTMLTQIQAGVVAAFADLGLVPDTKPFRAHLTLGRTRREAQPEQITRLAEAIRDLRVKHPMPPVFWDVERVVLYRSELRPEGSHYTQLEAVALVPLPQNTQK